eukprot:286866-Chlamydomonas_euryale.AAC.1
MVMDHADAVLRAVRGKALPWGGLQVVFVANMLQLGPIGEWFESGRPGAGLHNGKFHDLCGVSKQLCGHFCNLFRVC